jgi:hypothetical protein
MFTITVIPVHGEFQAVYMDERGSFSVERETLEEVLSVMRSRILVRVRENSEDFKNSNLIEDGGVL